MPTAHPHQLAPRQRRAHMPVCHPHAALHYADRHYMYLTAGWAKPYPWIGSDPHPTTPCGLHPTHKRIPASLYAPAFAPRQRRAHTHQQIPALAPKLQSSLITLGPRKVAVRRPQHGYRVRPQEKGLRSCPITPTPNSAPLRARTSPANPHVSAALIPTRSPVLCR